MNFTLEATCVLELEHKIGKETSNHVSTKFNLEVSKNLDQKHYLQNDGMPTKDGTKAITMVFTQGLIGNIHQAHENSLWDSAEHLRYIIAELEKGFVQVAYTSTSKF